MLRIDSKSLSFNGASIIDEEIAATMNASYHGGAEVYINMNITNIALYNEHKVIVDADFAAFSNEVMAVLSTDEAPEEEAM